MQVCGDDVPLEDVVVELDGCDVEQPQFEVDWPLTRPLYLPWRRCPRWRYRLPCFLDGQLEFFHDESLQVCCGDCEVEQPQFELLDVD